MKINSLPKSNTRKVSTAFRAVLVAIIAAGCGLGLPMRLFADDAHFNVNDVCFLWPAPQSGTDVDKLISLDDVLADGVNPIVPLTVFRLVLDTALNTGVQSSSGRVVKIAFPDPVAFQNPHTWKVVGIRVDPSAPGANDKAIAAFGSLPEIRLIVQPVTVGSDGTPQIHDFAMHLVFDFVLGFTIPATGEIAKAIPDKENFRKILDDLIAIKSGLQAAQVSTDGDLGVHPGFGGKTPDFSAKLKALVTKHLNSSRLDAVAFMGIQEPEPWIFLALNKQVNGTFLPLKHPSLSGGVAQMLNFSGGDHVVPAAVNHNFVGGVSTRLLFENSAASQLDSALFANTARPELQNIKLRDISDIIANPLTCNFLNTDCVSCHTESACRNQLNTQSGNDGFAFKRASGISGVAKVVLPTDIWNVRNFGWSPVTTPPETITMRTANEAAASADFINRNYFAQQTVAPAQNSTPPLTDATVHTPLGANLGLSPGPQATINPSPQGPSPDDEPVAATPHAGSPGSIGNALTLVMTIKTSADSKALKDFLTAAQNPKKNQITEAMNKLGIVHYARFVFLSDDKLAVITNYDGSFERYIGAFTNAIGPIFDILLSHMADAPPLPVASHRQEFLKYVEEHDLTFDQPTYSAYPRLKVQDILTLERNAEIKAAGK
jgi:hypothetical protein